MAQILTPQILKILTQPTFDFFFLSKLRTSCIYIPYLFFSFSFVLYIFSIFSPPSFPLVKVGAVNTSPSRTSTSFLHLQFFPISYYLQQSAAGPAFSLSSRLRPRFSIHCSSGSGISTVALSLLAPTTRTTTTGKRTFSSSVQTYSSQKKKSKKMGPKKQVQHEKVLLGRPGNNLKSGIVCEQRGFFFFFFFWFLPIWKPSGKTSYQFIVYP